MSAIEKKLSPATAGLATRLRAAYLAADEASPADATELVMQVDKGVLAVALDGYQITLSTGTERGVTTEDIEAVDTFKRDFGVAHRLVSGEIGYRRLGANDSIGSHRTQVFLSDNLSVAAQVYRPGKEPEGEPESDYASITSGWDLDESSKAVTAHLNSLRKKLTGATKAE